MQNLSEFAEWGETFLSKGQGFFFIKSRATFSMEVTSLITLIRNNIYLLTFIIFTLVDIYVHYTLFISEFIIFLSFLFALKKGFKIQLTFCCANRTFKDWGDEKSVKNLILCKHKTGQKQNLFEKPNIHIFNSASKKRYFGFFVWEIVLILLQRHSIITLSQIKGQANLLVMDFLRPTAVEKYRFGTGI